MTPSSGPVKEPNQPSGRHVWGQSKKRNEKLLCAKSINEMKPRELTALGIPSEDPTALSILGSRSLTVPATYDLETQNTNQYADLFEGFLAWNEQPNQIKLRKPVVKMSSWLMKNFKEKTGSQGLSRPIDELVTHRKTFQWEN